MLFLRGLRYQSTKQAYSRAWPGLTIIFRSASGLHTSAGFLLTCHIFSAYSSQVPGTSVPTHRPCVPSLRRIGPTLLANLPRSSSLDTTGPRYPAVGSNSRPTVHSCCPYGPYYVLRHPTAFLKLAPIPRTLLRTDPATTYGLPSTPKRTIPPSWNHFFLALT